MVFLSVSVTEPRREISCIVEIVSAELLTHPDDKAQTGQVFGGSLVARGLI
jgi:hypothetical protein